MKRLLVSMALAAVSVFFVVFGERYWAHKRLVAPDAEATPAVAIISTPTPTSVGALISTCYKSCDTWVHSWKYTEKPLDFSCTCKNSDQIAPLPSAEPQTGGI